MSATLTLALSVFDNQFQPICSGVLSDFGGKPDALTAKLSLTLDGQAYQMELTGKAFEYPAGGVSLFGGSSGHLGVSRACRSI